MNQLIRGARNFVKDFLSRGLLDVSVEKTGAAKKNVITVFLLSLIRGIALSGEWLRTKNIFIHSK